MDRPWLKLFTRDWLDDPVLRRCSPTSRSILVDLMCLAQEGSPYGHLADKLGALSETYMASRCFVPEVNFKSSILELTTMERVHRTEAGVLFVKRMVRDEEIRLRRAEGGKLGGNPDLVNLEVNLKERQRLTIKDNHKVKQTTEGYPSSLTNGGSEGYLPPRARDGRALTLTLPSDSESQKLEVSQSGESLDDWYERQYARHPKKRDKVLGQQQVVEHLRQGKLNLADCERIHVAWCESEGWRWKHGAAVKQTYAQWISDEGYRYMPNGHAKTEAQPETSTQVLEREARQNEADEAARIARRATKAAAKETSA